MVRNTTLLKSSSIYDLLKKVFVERFTMQAKKKKTFLDYIDQRKKKKKDLNEGRCLHEFYNQKINMKKISKSGIFESAIYNF